MGHIHYYGKSISNLYIKHDLNNKILYIDIDEPLLDKIRSQLRFKDIHKLLYWYMDINSLAPLSNVDLYRFYHNRICGENIRLLEDNI